ncbi:hypothetical protein Bca52824_062346 [Brassica carinata]|uniref:Uncharacterized protein n=1 Tax=Brassica carinata TaxID=52824 RepID=A0A8X7QCJ8_BRACI|nr:hypothetical protein Bca52824_062346 [Brassica carinata]
MLGQGPNVLKFNAWLNSVSESRISNYTGNYMETSFCGKREFTQLVKSIHSDPTPPLPGNASRPFLNLIESLLIKDPAQRIQWADLCGHAFWMSKI